MLLPSRRHTPADLARWEHLAAMDAVIARSRHLQRREDRAIDVLAEFGSGGPCYVGVSWGKDSVVVAHLAWQLEQMGGPRLPVVWFPAADIENPDCPLVRDAFLSRFPVEYQEIEVGEPVLPAFNPGEGHDGFQAAFERESRRVASRYVSGVRAEESGIRELRMRMDSEISANTCRPIGWWSGQDVFAYLAKHDLPIHPAYAMSFGGTLDRSKIRVSTIGGDRGRRFGRLEWERRYYREVVERLEGSAA